MRRSSSFLVVAVSLVAVGVATAAKPKAPKIAKHANVRAEATGPTGALVAYSPAAVTGAKSVSYSKPSGSLFPLGKTIVTITARNGTAVARSSFAVDVVDTTPPAFAPLPDITAKAGVPVTYGPVSATDVVDKQPQVGCSPTSGAVFPAGQTYVTCTARDASGNASTAGFWVTVPANAAPRFPSPMQTTTNTSFMYDSLGRLVGATTTMTVSAATDPDGDPVSYTWTATNGSISGNGTSATWTRVIQGGQPSKGSVTVTASDGRGGTDTFTINFL